MYEYSVVLLYSEADLLESVSRFLYATIDTATKLTQHNKNTAITSITLILIIFAIFSRIYHPHIDTLLFLTKVRAYPGTPTNKQM